jgi:hypothetical protein
MQSSNSNYQELINKLDAFIRKYYTNQLIRGGLYAFTLLLGFYLAVTVLESYAWFNASVRSVLFYSYLLATALVLWRLVIIPLLKLYKLGAIISHAEAAQIVGGHFPEIKDKLLNTLQLHDQSLTGDHLDLVNASINQKSASLRPVPFSSAVDFSKNKKYFKIAAIPVVVFLTILFAAPSLITDSTKRLLQHNTAFSKPAPFEFAVLNKKLQATQYTDFNLEVKLSGKEIPVDVFIEIGGNQFRLERENRVLFNYVIRNIQGDTPFRLMADGYTSSEYILKAVPNPLVVDFTINLDYPTYLGKQDELLKNTGDLIVPTGTKITWNFGTQNTSSLRLRFTDTTYVLNQSDVDKYVFSRRLVQANQYSIRTINQYMESKDSMQYSIVVVPDQYPGIQVEEEKEEGSYQEVYFRGMVRDDYGLSKLQLRYRFLKREGDEVNEDIQAVNVPFNKGTIQEQFFYFLDLKTLAIKPGDEIEYYFEVWDNDGVAGPKSAKSQSNLFKAPSTTELAEDAEKKNQALKNDLAESIKKAKDLQKEMKDIQRDMLNKKNLDYEDKKKIADVLKDQKELEKKLEDIKKQNEQNKRQQSEFKNLDPELAKKQQQLEELFDKLMTPEMKKMMEEMEKLLAEADKQKLQEMMDKMKLDNKDMEKQLDRTLELYKKMELEQQIKETAENLEKLAEDQEKLAKESEQKSAKSDEIKKEQEKLGEEFDKLKEALDEIEKKNEELEYSQEMDNFDKDQESIEKDMEQSEQELGEQKSQKAAKSQKGASDKMKQLSQKMKQQQQQKEQEENEEDEQAMRMLLENLLRFSFDQEALMQDLKSIDVNNPRYLKMAQQQRKLKDDAAVLEDSLLALSKRVAKISSSVNEQITSINDNTEKALANLQDRFVPQARSNQQFIMTAVNNLTLMLSESLDDMQQEMMESKPSNSSCKKPGKGKGKPGPSAGDVRKMQEKLSQQLKEMKEKMDKQGGKQKGGQGGQGMSEELARMAAQQSAMRTMLNQLNQQENKDGKGKLGDLGKIAEQMEKNEEDIVNKRITEMTLKRQQEIMTRLLESEKAEREREQEERRESNQAKEYIRSSPKFEEYKKLKLKETELLKTIPPSFTTFYKNLVNSYFQSIDEQQR